MKRKTTTIIVLLMVASVIGMGASPNRSSVLDVDCGCITLNPSSGDSCFQCFYDKARNEHFLFLNENGMWQGNYHEELAPGTCSSHQHTADCGPQDNQLVSLVQSANGTVLKALIAFSRGTIVFNKDRGAIQFMGGCKGTLVVGHIPCSPEQIEEMCNQ